MPRVAKSDRSGNISLTPIAQLRAIAQILRSKRWSPVKIKDGRSYISFSPEIDEDPKRAGDWSLHVLVVPDIERPEHSHFHLNLRELKRLYSYLGKLIAHIEGLRRDER